MFVWLGGRADVPRLQAALSHLSHVYPVVASRLNITDPRGPCWQFQQSAEAALHRVDVQSVPNVRQAGSPSCGGDRARQAVLQRAAELLSTPHDLAESAPIRFYLLHGPDGRDVFLAQYNHALMDNNAAVLLLRELDRLSVASACERADQGVATGSNAMLRPYIRRFPRSRRRQSVPATIAQWRQGQRGGVARLAAPATRPDPVRVRIATRVLDADAAQAVQARSMRACGFPSLSMALVASVFRAIAALNPQEQQRNANFCVGLGVDLGLRSPSAQLPRGVRGLPIFHNLMSLVPVHARWDDLADREELTRRLSRQLRERLAADMDLGVLQLARHFSRRPDLAQWAVDVLFRHSFSLWYAYFGSLDAVAPDPSASRLGGEGDTWCGVRVDDVFFAGPTWSPIGITLLVNQFRQRLLFQATYVPELVTDSLANTFLDTLLADLNHRA
jgi:hypothetical protein